MKHVEYEEENEEVGGGRERLEKADNNNFVPVCMGTVVKFVSCCGLCRPRLSRKFSLHLLTLHFVEGDRGMGGRDGETKLRTSGKQTHSNGKVHFASTQKCVIVSEQ
jgi:hypothetical protein